MSDMEDWKAERKAWKDSIWGWVRENVPDWREEEPVGEWIEEISSPRTKENCLRDFAFFLGFVRMSPSEIIRKRLEDWSSRNAKVRSFFEHQVILYKNALAEHHYGESSIRTYVNRVQSFFAHNYVALSLPRGALRVELSEALKRQRRAELVLDNIQLRLVYGAADVEDRVLLLCLYHLGLSPADASNLRVEQLGAGPDTEDFHYFEIWREKTDVPVRTCLSPELVHDMSILLSLRGWPKEGYVNQSRDGNRLLSRYVNDRLKALVEKALGPEIAEDFQAKSIRNSFNEALLEAHLNPELKDCLFGHKRKGAREDYSVSRNAIVEAYKKVLPLISMDSYRQAVEDRDRLEGAVEDLSRRYTALETQNEVLRKRSEERFEKYDAIIGELRGEVEVTDRRADLLARFLFEEKGTGLEEWERWLEEHEGSHKV